MSSAPEKAWADFQTSVNPYRWFETTAMTIAAPVLGFAVKPDDPFFLNADYPWITFAPLLVGLRYGFAHAFSSSLAILMAVLVLSRTNTITLAAFPTNAAVGMMLVSMLSGEFTDMWKRRLQRLDVVNDYRRLKLAEFTRAYHLLKVSHDRLEQRLVGTTNSLRGSLLELQQHLVKHEPTQSGMEALGGFIMAILSNYGSVQVAALYPASENGDLSPKAAKRHGEPPPLNAKHPMIVEALKRTCLISVKDGFKSERADESPLVVIPLFDVSNKLWGLVSVHEIPFAALNEQNLNLLAVLGGHIADVFTERAMLKAGRDMDGQRFKHRLARSSADAYRYGIPSAVVVMRFGPPCANEDLHVEVMKLRRGLDQEWMLKDSNGNPVIMMIMPLTDKAGVRGYTKRINDFVLERLQISAKEAQLDIHAVEIDGEEVYEKVLEGLLGRFDIDA